MSEIRIGLTIVAIKAMVLIGVVKTFDRAMRKGKPYYIEALEIKRLFESKRISDKIRLWIRLHVSNRVCKSTMRDRVARVW